jgi:hypothetical protein
MSQNLEGGSCSLSQYTIETFPGETGNPCKIPASRSGRRERGNCTYLEKLCIQLLQVYNIGSYRKINNTKMYEGVSMSFRIESITK